MKKAFRLAALMLLAAAAPAQAAVVDKVVAVVNDRVVTLSELHREMKDSAPNPEGKKDARQVLGSMVDRILLDQEAARRKISVSDDEVRAIMKNRQEALGLDEKAIAKELRKQKISEDAFRREWKYQILSRRILDSVMKGSIAVTEEEIDEYQREHYEEDAAGEAGKQTKIAHILIGAETADAASQAEEILALAKAGDDFGELAQKHSMDESSSQNGGVLGYFSKGDLVEEIEKAVEKTETGGLAGPVKTDRGYHVIKVLERTGDEDSSVRRYRDRIRHDLYVRKVEKFITSWLENLKKKSYVEIKI